MACRYITGRGGSPEGGLTKYLKTLSNNVEVLAVDADFLSQSVEEQVQAIREFSLISEEPIIANSYGAYLLLLSLIDQPPLAANVLLLSPVIGRAVNRQKMAFSRPPREKSLWSAITEGRLGIPANMLIVTGEDDEICDCDLAISAAGLMNVRIALLENEGHMIDHYWVSHYVSSFLNIWPEPTQFSEDLIIHSATNRSNKG